MVGLLTRQGVEIVRSSSRDLLSILKDLGGRSVQSVLVEGGAHIAGSFVDAQLVNKATFFVAPKIVGGSEAPGAVAGKGVGKMADALELEGMEIIRRGRDVEITGYPGMKDEG
jgi:diaminohydroxyphosphoribosylaminopyrimidine deaminase/5-amino-6-(5-phosphoribosylamino)uracil reductase